MGKILVRLAPAALVAVLFPQDAAFAQADVAARPIFGGAASPTRGRSLDLTMNVGESYDQNISLGAGGSPTSPFQRSGFFSTLAPTLDFRSRGEDVKLEVRVGSNIRYYSDLHRAVVNNHYLGASLSAQWTRRTTASLNQVVSYSPVYLYGLFGRFGALTSSEVAVPASGYAITDQGSYSSSTSAGLIHRVSSRTALSVNADLGYTQIPSYAGDTSNLRTLGVGSRLTYSVSRDLNLRLGYTYRQSRYSGLFRPNEHIIDAGLEYTRPLSRTKRASIGINVGPARVTDPSSPDIRQNRVTAGAFVQRQIGRTWRVRGAFDRASSYVPGAAAPLYTNGVTSEAVGFLNRRADVSLLGAYSQGESTSGAAGALLKTYTADARMRIAVNRELAVYFEYLVYSYSFDARIPLVASLPHDLTRNSVQAGVTLWIPVRHR